MRPKREFDFSRDTPTLDDFKKRSTSMMVPDLRLCIFALNEGFHSRFVNISGKKNWISAVIENWKYLAPPSSPKSEWSPNSVPSPSPAWSENSASSPATSPNSPLRSVHVDSPSSSIVFCPKLSGSSHPDPLSASFPFVFPVPPSSSSSLPSLSSSSSASVSLSSPHRLQIL